MSNGQLELQINEAKGNLMCIEQGECSCKDCCFESTEDCTGIACSNHERQDKKHVIYKVIKDTKNKEMTGALDYEQLNINYVRYVRGEDECSKSTESIS